MAEQEDPVKRAAEYIRRPNSSAGDYILSGFNVAAKWIALSFGTIGLFLLVVLMLANIISRVFFGNFDTTPWLLGGLILISVLVIILAGIVIFIRKLWRWLRKHNAVDRRLDDPNVR
jgi:uncharacterized integral membrane protein